MEEYEADVVIVGAGLSGAVMAERFARVLGKRVLILEKRNHIGGNCHDEVDENGILVNTYGAHLFHTQDQGVWEYIQQFDRWIRWEHEVIANLQGRLVPVPVNITTVNILCEENLATTEDMEVWLREHQEVFPHHPLQNSDEVARSRVGARLYELLFRNYTKKQWNQYPEDLQPEVLSRIPVRNNFDTRYFSDRYQALPHRGYTHFFTRLLDHPNIRVRLESNFFEVRSLLQAPIIVYTGPIDQFFSESGYPPLEYRSLVFQRETLKNTPYFQPNSVVNYPGPEVPFTRIVEYKHFLHQQSPHTTIVREYSSDTGEPYYPVPSTKNQQLYESYRVLADAMTKEHSVHFLGRLANYKYFNMDQAIRNALDYFENNFSSLEKKTDDA